MLRVALKDLLARKRRLVTTSIAVVLGIAFLTGTQLLSATLTNSIRSLVGDVYSGVDAVVRSSKTTDTPFGQPLRTPIDASVLAEVQRVEGVEVAQGVVEATGSQIIGRDGKILGGGIGPPTITYNWNDDSIMGSGGLSSGRGPVADDEIALDFNSASAIGARPGDPVKVATLKEGVKTYTLVGTVGIGKEADRSTGAKVMFFTTPVAQAIAGEDGKYNFIVVKAAPGLSQRDIATRLAKALPEEQVVTGAAFVEENQQQISKFVDILDTFVSVFGWIALFVAVFIIYNTFSIIVQQRTRETALLRAVGARRRQVLGASMLEAVIVGLIASVLGLALGVVIASILAQLMQSVFTVSGGVAAPGASTFLFAVVVGIGITVVSALIPAWRSTRIPPVAAMSEVSLDRADVSRSRKAWGLALIVLGGGLIAMGLLRIGPNPLVLVGGGAVLVLVSVALVIGPTIASPLSRLLARPLTRAAGVSGRLAGENAARNPKRTASTAAALTIGVTLVTLIAVVASSIRESTDRVVNQSVRADFVVSNADVTSLGAIPNDLVARIRELPTVEVASPMRLGLMRLLDSKARARAEGVTTTVPTGTFGVPNDAPPGDDVAVLGIDPSTWFGVMGTGSMQGSPRDMKAGTLAVAKSFAEERGWHLGETIPVYFGATGLQELKVALIWDKNVGQGNIWLRLPLETFSANQLPIFDADYQIYVKARPGASMSELRRQLDGLVKGLPTVTVQDLKQYAEAQTAPIDSFLAIVYGLLALAILIALIGISNTLSLSILERTRELGLLRAVGMSRRQMRRTVRFEAAIIAVFGAMMGLVLGIVFSAALSVSISARNPGLFTYHLPVAQLVVITVIAALAGLVAAWLPSRRAARLDILQAIAAN